MWLKVHIFIIWALDTAHEILLLGSVYVYLVKDIDDLLALDQNIS